MPRPSLPPTPAPSTDIKGQQSPPVDQSDSTFVLPPSAVSDGTKNQSTGISQVDEAMAATGAVLTPTNSLEQTRGPPSPQSQATLRADISLPPPPSRSRKIIQVQMKPKSQEKQRSSQPRRSARAAEAQAVDKSSAAESSVQAQATPSSSSTPAKKSAGANTAAGRKVARKTAHSIIERRRRSKMNEEFGILKDLIPACRGYEMHKLAILQASIDYLRYLERCVAELKANQANNIGVSADIGSHDGSSDRKSSIQHDQSASNEESDHEDIEEQDHEMDVDGPEHKQDQRRSREADIDIETEHTWTKSAYRDSPVSSISGTTAITSPAFSAYSQSRHRPSTATLPSPVFGPIWSHDGRQPSQFSGYDHYGGRASYSNSTQTSPSIMPMNQNLEQSEDLNEASAALLMLNAKDRRNLAPAPSAAPPPKKTEKPSGQRGMSVKDLLRT